MVETFQLTVNGTAQEVTCDRDTPLLYVLRNHLNLKGTRFGCGLGLCGACNVIIDGRTIFSCDTPLWSVVGKNIRTVEGLPADSPLRRMFVEEQAAQCGYCVSGIVMSATALLESTGNPDERAVKEALDRNLCRCGAHNRMVRAVLRAGE
ncbi:(2Fe-2S)-binding protein [Actinocrispum sp. NPDC049592]|uniref:(2Fe-2S)-binding protein n=1 Tax=Actinocrispum sp. NPDC049592 TaxID=3154835 RepID=UPI00343942F4